MVFAVLFILLLQRARGGLVSRAALPAARATGATDSGCRSSTAVSSRTRGQPILTVSRDSPLRRPGGRQQRELRGGGGEILGLIGPNGAGKTTHVQSDHRRPLPLDQGAWGTFASRHHPAAAAPDRRAGIARTFQHVKLRPPMTLLDTCCSGPYGAPRPASCAGVAARRSRRRGKHAPAPKRCATAGNGSASRRKLSSWRQSASAASVLEIARALAADPALLVSDEPAAGLHVRPRRRNWRSLSGRCAGGPTILLVEHDMDFVMGLVDRAVVMDFGSKLARARRRSCAPTRGCREAYLGGVGWRCSRSRI